MNVSFVQWKDWDAVKCVAGEYTLTIGISAGPRILSFSYNGGENMLYEDQTGFRVGEWRMYGGHRFTVAPESDASYYPDNEPCGVKIEGAAVHIAAQQRSNGLTLSLVISASLQGFCIDHVLVNGGIPDWEGALWAITCVPRAHILFGACKTNNINFWPGTDASKWKQADGRISVDDGAFRGKTGWYSITPELKAIGQQGAFTIISPVISTPELCVDNNSNAEIFVCPYWAELETLSEKFLVAPGGSVSHRQYWQFVSRQHY
jgi:hypothetical protein